MTFDELKAAYAAGATIQIRNRSSDGYSITEEWIDLEAPRFNSFPSRYRIKPTEENQNDI